MVRVYDKFKHITRKCLIAVATPFSAKSVFSSAFLLQPQTIRRHIRTKNKKWLVVQGNVRLSHTHTFPGDGKQTHRQVFWGSEGRGKGRDKKYRVRAR